MTPPAVSKPMDRGVTTHSRKSCCEDGGLHSRTESNRFVRDRWIRQVPSREERLDHLLRGPTGKNHIMHITFADAAVAGSLVHGTHGVSKVNRVQLLKPGLRHGKGELNAVQQGIDLYRRCLEQFFFIVNYGRPPDLLFRLLINRKLDELRVLPRALFRLLP